MTWRLHRWVWRLEAPVHIGMPPAGSLNRCRLYVPARAMWGAVTAETARSTRDSFPDYPAVGEKISRNCRFTYLYPAEKLQGKFSAWTPRFVEKKGLVWRRHGDDAESTERKFRRCLLDARPGTAIEPTADAAAEGTLRETECILPWWRDGKKNVGAYRPMYLLGYLFTKEEGLEDRILSIKVLFVGGDTRYGLGRIRREDVAPISDVFGLPTRLDEENPVVKGDAILAHAPVEAHSDMRGSKELRGWWNHGCKQESALGWAPGSKARSEIDWRIKPDGCWHVD